MPTLCAVFPRSGGVALAEEDAGFQSEQANHDQGVPLPPVLQRRADHRGRGTRKTPRPSSSSLSPSSSYSFLVLSGPVYLPSFLCPRGASLCPRARGSVLSPEISLLLLHLVVVLVCCWRDFYGLRFSGDRVPPRLRPQIGEERASERELRGRASCWRRTEWCIAHVHRCGCRHGLWRRSVSL